MTITRHTCSAAAVSWIDERLFHLISLPEVDSGSTKRYVDAGSLSRSALVARTGYRFVNFVAAFVELNGRKIEKCGFESTSEMYRSPSFMGIPSEAYELRQRSIDSPDKIEFLQLAGCRTQSPEKIGAAAGESFCGPVVADFCRRLGREVAEELMVFPPIWSEVRLTFHMGGDGYWQLGISRHSHFPSMTLYLQRQVGSVDSLFDRVLYFDARATKNRWLKNGWGCFRDLGIARHGPTAHVGNPWQIPSPSGWGDNRDTTDCDGNDWCDSRENRGIFHDVQEGEWGSGIGLQHGFSDVGPIWSHPMNAEICGLRSDPDHLKPGVDCLFVPQPRQKEVICAIDRTYIFEVSRKMRTLTFQLSNADGTPRKNVPCVIEIGGTIRTTTERDAKTGQTRAAVDRRGRVKSRTDNNGRIEVRFPDGLNTGSLLVLDDPKNPEVYPLILRATPSTSEEPP